MAIESEALLLTARGPGENVDRATVEFRDTLAVIPTASLDLIRINSITTPQDAFAPADTFNPETNAVVNFDFQYVAELYAAMDALLGDTIPNVIANEGLTELNTITRY